jgi:hypothetical protein
VSTTPNLQALLNACCGVLVTSPLDPPHHMPPLVHHSNVTSTTPKSLVEMAQLMHWPPCTAPTPDQLVVVVYVVPHVKTSAKAKSPYVALLNTPRMPHV